MILYQNCGSCLKLLVKPQHLPVGIELTLHLVLDIVGALPVVVAAVGARDECVAVVAGVARLTLDAAGLLVWRLGVGEVAGHQLGVVALLKDL